MEAQVTRNFVQQFVDYSRGMDPEARSQELGPECCATYMLSTSLLMLNSILSSISFTTGILHSMDHGNLTTSESLDGKTSRS